MFFKPCPKGPNITPIRRLAGRKNLLFLSLIAVMIVAVVSIGFSEQKRSPQMTITYIANTGFLVECGDKKILIDALFGNFKSDWCFVPPDSTVELMAKAQPPFDDVDIIAITHAHKDHFNANIVIDHLLHNRPGILVCPEQAAETLSSLDHYGEIHDRVRVVSVPLDSVASLEVAGVKIKAIRTSHSPYYEEDTLTGESVDRHRGVEHLEYIFTVAGQAIYHSGDAIMNDILKYDSYGFGKEPVDLAFVGWWDAREVLTFQQKLVRDIIRPERVIFMHLLPGREPEGHPERQKTVAREVFVPQKSMQKWVFPIETKQESE